MSQVKKGGLRQESGQTGGGVFTAAHTCTGHICECPPPPCIYYMEVSQEGDTCMRVNL